MHWLQPSQLVTPKAPLWQFAHKATRFATCWLPGTHGPSGEGEAREEAEATELLDQARCGFHALDNEGRIVRINHTELALLARREHEVLGRPFREFLTPEAAERFEEIRLQHSRSDGAQEAELDLLRPDGVAQPVLVKSCPLRRTDRLPGSRAVVLDFGEHRRAKLALEALSRVDPLTELGNRRDFFDRAERELARSCRLNEPLALMILDLDHFKRINDQRGHLAGDEVLRHFSGLCRQGLRTADIAGRLGGEEFAVLMPATDEATAKVVAERMRGAMETNVAITPEGDPVACTVSIGITTRATDTASVRDLLRKADAALYDAKRNGRNQARVR